MPIPALTNAQVTALEEMYPPKCHDPKAETEEDHQAYRGKVELIAALRSALPVKVSYIDPTNPGGMSVEVPG